MIKDVFKLKKKAWYTRMMKWIWGYEHYDFRNMCPFFWLTVLNVIIFIPFSFFKLLIKGITSIGAALVEWVEEREERWCERYFEKIKSGDKDAIYNAYNAWEKSYYNMPKKYRLLYNTFDSKLTWIEREKYKEIYKEMLNEAYKKRDEKIARLREEKERIIATAKPKKPRKSRQERIGYLTVKIKYVAKVIGYLFVAALCYGCYLGVMWMMTLDWGVVGNVSLDVLLWALLGWGVVGFLYLVFTTISSVCEVVFNYCIACEARRKKIWAFIKWFSWLGYIGVPFIYIGLYIWKFLCFIGRKIGAFWELLMAIKSNNCPGIDWE